LAVALTAAAAPVAAEEAAGAPIVRRILVRSAVPVDLTELAPLVALTPGEPLTAAAVRRTLRSLSLAGLGSEVAIHAQPVPDGVEVELVLLPDLLVAAVEIAGSPGLAPERLRAALPQKAGQPLREDRVLRGIYRIEELLGVEGWSSPSIRLEVAPAPAAGAVNIVYRVEAGARTQVTDVRVTGVPAALAAEALGELRTKPGQPWRPGVAREDGERLHRFLVRRGWRLAAVEGVDALPGAEPNRVDVRFAVTLGPQVEVEIRGAERRTLERRGLLPFLGDEGFDDALVAHAIGLIRTDYQARGHYRIEVEESRVEHDGRLRVRLDIVPGERYVLDEVHFEGNESFDEATLERLLRTAPRRLLTLGVGRLVDEELAEDLTNLRSFYALSGFDRARIGPPEVEEPRPGRLRVVVPIVEGERRTVGRIELEGLESLPVAATLAELPLRPGGPYHLMLLEASLDQLRARLERLGHRTAIVESELAWDDSGRVVDVTLRVLEGERSSVEAILVRGNQRTRTSVVRRFVALEPGDPISSEGLLDVQRALYRLGVFSRVDVRVPATDAEFAAHEVLIELEEGRSRAVAYGVGYDSESGARGLLRLSHANVGGRAATLQFDALVAQRDQLYRALFRQPYLGRWPVESRALVYRQTEDRPSFDVEREGLQVGIERRFGDRRVALFAEYRIVELESDAPEEILPRESRNARVASLTPSFFWDRRDDPVDATTGWSAAISLERAFPVADADADFEKLFAQWTQYASLGGGTLGGSIRLGALFPRGGSGAIDEVPASERYYAGGRTTHRAFARDELGVPGETLFVDGRDEPLPLGGGALGLLNLEWRFPLFGGFGGVVFVDAGNVWREIDMVDLSQTRWGAGVGVRYASPIGPIRLEVGWKLDRKSFEDSYVAFISLGNAF
jgi:outer membrane protein insertion porin family